MERTCLRQDKLEDITTPRLRISLTNRRAVSFTEIQDKVEVSIRLTKALLPKTMVLVLARFKGRLNTDTPPQNFWTTFLDNDLTEKFKKSAVANAIAIPLPLCFSFFVPLRRFLENLTKPFYFYLSRTCDSPGGTPSVISLALIWYCCRKRSKPEPRRRVQLSRRYGPAQTANNWRRFGCHRRRSFAGKT